MTDAMVHAARLAAPDIEFIGWTSFEGPASIQGDADGIAAEAPLLELVAQAERDGVQGIIIGCFDDTALNQAARMASCPVIGIGQAAYIYAALRQLRFSVVTTLAVSVPILERNISAYGLSGLLGQVRASDVAVLDLEADPKSAGRKILTEARNAQTEDGIDAVILGCGGMVQVFDRVKQDLDVAVLDPVACAARSFRWLI